MALARRRTVLAVVVGATLLARLLVHRLGAVGLVAVAVAMPVCAWLLWSTGRPGRRPLGSSAALLAGVIIGLAAIEVCVLVFDSAGTFSDAGH